MPRRNYSKNRPRPHGYGIDVDWLIRQIANDRAQRRYVPRPLRSTGEPT